ncbi:hypothetical protein ACO0QE_003144 [Hanseniaspora vineae]
MAGNFPIPDNGLLLPVYSNASENDSSSEMEENENLDVVDAQTTIESNGKLLLAIEKTVVKSALGSSTASEYEDEDESEEEQKHIKAFEIQEHSKNQIDSVETKTLKIATKTATSTIRENHLNALKKIKLYTKLEGINYVSTNTYTYIGLQNDEQLFVVGHMNFQIVKGGLMYNTQHFNASPSQNYNVHHPILKAIAPLQSSHYASFQEEIFLSKGELHSLEYANRQKSYHDSDDYKKFASGEDDYFRVNDYQTILKVRHNSFKSLHINDVNVLCSKYTNVWKSVENEDYLQDFQILSRQELHNIRTLSIPQDWKQTIQQLLMKFHDPQQTNLRVMIIGGKNSGKSTLNKVLLQNFLYSMPNQTNCLNYIDLDLGQPEFSTPTSISCAELQTAPVYILGDPLVQRNAFPEHAVKIVKEVFFGSANPNLYPVTYMKSCVELINTMFSYDSINPTLINLPGWVKGFGIEFLQEIIKAYKPTDLIVLESVRQAENSELMNDLHLSSLPEFYSEVEQSPYRSKIWRLRGIFKDADKSLVQHHWHASHIREYKLLAYLHQTKQGFDFIPLLQQTPKRLSFQKPTKQKAMHGLIKGFKFSNTLGVGNKVTDKDIGTIINCLQGSVIGLHTVKWQDRNGIVRDGKGSALIQLNSFQNKFPIVQQFHKDAEINLLALCVIHSVNIEKGFVNLYVPERYHSEIMSAVQSESVELVVVKSCMELPVCELIPENGFLVEYMKCKELTDLPPFISSNKKRKLNDHVWKVRSNILRRGQTPEK